MVVGLVACISNLFVRFVNIEVSLLSLHVLIFENANANV